MCAVIGSTGAGKSTLTQLITRNYALQGGNILVHGRDVGRFDLPELRAMLALAPQNPSLFTASIHDNIAWGWPGADRGLVEEAARIAQADEFIRAFPQGYESLLGRGGINVSGGQRQRISLARALVRVLSRRRAGGDSLLLLDDCTSAVDVITEAKIRKAIQGLGQGLSCLWITQRAATAMRSHAVLVLEEGSVAGFGTHARLLRDCSIYRDICVSQLGKEVLDAKPE